MTHLRVAVDIGGTFTDICILDDRDGSLEITKVVLIPFVQFLTNLFEFFRQEVTCSQSMLTVYTLTDTIFKSISFGLPKVMA